MLIGPCWRCELPGHGWRECRRPAAENRQELDKRIDRILRRWDAGYGELSTYLKTEFITAEKNAFEKEKAK